PAISPAKVKAKTRSRSSRTPGSSRGRTSPGRMLRGSAAGCPSCRRRRRRDAGTGCRRRRSGSTPAGPARQRPTTSARPSASSVPGPDLRYDSGNNFLRTTPVGQYPARKGLRWLAKLLLAPNRLFTVAEMLGDPEGRLTGDALLGGELETDREGAREIGKRLVEIEATIAETGGGETPEAEKAGQLRRAKHARRGRGNPAPPRKTHPNHTTPMPRDVSPTLP